MEWVNNIKILKFKWCMIQLDRQIIFPVGEVKAREEVKLRQETYHKPLKTCTTAAKPAFLCQMHDPSVILHSKFICQTS